MSDTEAKGSSELFTRKSSRQKTPNTYYKIDISDIKGEPKPKSQKQSVQKGLKTKKKSEKNQPKSDLGVLATTYQLTQQLQGKQGFQKENDDLSASVDEEDEFGKEIDQKQDEGMEMESNPASDAPEGSDHQDSPSMSQDESKKSYQNNANSSNTENEDISNKMAGGYQTRKIRKKPKFADDNYIDNMPISKTLQPKKLKTTKPELTKKTQKQKKESSQNFIENQGSNKENTSSAQQVLDSVTVPSSNNHQVSQVASQQKAPTKISNKAVNQRKGEKQVEEKIKENINEKGSKEKKETQKKEKTDDILKGGLLDMFLDAIVQAKQDDNDLSPIDNKGNQNINAYNGNHNTSSINRGNNTTHINFSQNQNSNNQNAVDSQNNVASGNQSKNSKRTNDEDKQKLNQLEDNVTQKKKVKTSKKDKKNQGNSEDSSQLISMDNIQNEAKNNKKGEVRSVSNSIENNLNGISKGLENRESNLNIMQSIQHNGTIYNFPNINSNSDCITHVDKSKDKFVIHHSSFAPMEINRIYLKEDVRNKIDMQSLLSQITLQQIQKQQQQQSQNTIQKFVQLLEQHKKDQVNPNQMNTQNVPQTALNMLQNLLSKNQTINQQQNQVPIAQLAIQQQLSLLAQQSNSDKTSMIQQLLLRTLGQNGTNLLNNGQNFFGNNINIQENGLRGQVLNDTFNLTSNALQTSMNGNKQTSILQSQIQNKSRSQSQEFEPSLVQRKLSEHFKISKSSDEEEAQQNVMKQPSRKSSNQSNTITQGVKKVKEEQGKKQINNDNNNSFRKQDSNQNNLIEDQIEKALTQLNQMNQIHQSSIETKKNQNEMEIETVNAKKTVNERTGSDAQITNDVQIKEERQLNFQQQENQSTKQQENVEDENEDSVETEEDEQKQKNNKSGEEEEESQNNKNEDNNKNDYNQNINQLLKQQIDNLKVDSNETPNQQLSMQQQLLEMILNIKPQASDIKS